MYENAPGDYASALSRANRKAADSLKELVSVMEDWDETMQVLADGKLVQDIKESGREAAHGKFVKFEKLLDD
ncbi:hypothetical protein HY995_04285 [Candidatus Micrarchaeota archaeon]|nr:hypothetical protein [Candidatus Micrarchaeota archaeon]MBI5177274.1 hypothetical protein [Candidatus Micrarchaeota archaeon]